MVKREIEEIIEKIRKDDFSILDDFLNSIEKETLIVKETSEPVVFIGDLHGDFNTLENIIKKLLEKYTLIFLGDYVDRGPMQLETLLGVLYLKSIYPKRVYVLRGNHEHSWMNFRYGFISSLLYRLENWKYFYYNYILKIYEKLPIAMLLKVNQRKVFAVHGGIPISIPSLEDIARLRKRENIFEDEILLQLLWNDPDELIDEYDISFRGEGIYVFGRRILERFLSKNNIDLIVRAHEPVENGVQSLFNGKLYTVFSCQYYGITPGALLLGREIRILNI